MSVQTRDLLPAFLWKRKWRADFDSIAGILQEDSAGSQEVVRDISDSCQMYARAKIRQSTGDFGEDIPKWIRRKYKSGGV